MHDQPRRRAEVNGLHVQFFSRNTELQSVRWHPRFKLRYRSKADAVRAKQAWEEKGRILFPEDIKAAIDKAKPSPVMGRRETEIQQDMRF